MKKSITIITTAGIAALITVLNRVNRGRCRFNLAEGRPTPEDIDKMSPRQLARLEREQEDFLNRLRTLQTC
jgi:hypothetical protein